MARPKEFDRDEVLDRAVQLFWQQGYDATSLDDLLRAMGISRQSLYDTFGDKHALFLASVERYRARSGESLRTCFVEAGGLRAGLRRLFLSIVDEPDEDKRRGCFMVNTAMELAAQDAEAAKLVAEHHRNLEGMFFRLVTAAIERGEISPKAKPRALARFLLMSLEGLRVAAKTDPNRAALRDMVDVTLEALER